MSDYRSGGENSASERMIYYMLSEMHCVKAGKIAAFDAATNLAKVKPVVKIKVWEGGEPSYRELDVLFRVPVVTFSSPVAGLCVTQPVREGDPCLLLFADTMLDDFIDSFAKGGECVCPEQRGGDNKTSVPRIHHLTDGICLVGLRGVRDAIPNWNNDALEIRNYDRTAYVSLGTDAAVTIKTTGNVSVTADGRVDINGAGGVYLNGG